MSRRTLILEPTRANRKRRSSNRPPWVTKPDTSSNSFRTRYVAARKQRTDRNGIHICKYEECTICISNTWMKLATPREKKGRSFWSSSCVPHLGLILSAYAVAFETPLRSCAYTPEYVVLLIVFGRREGRGGQARQQGSCSWILRKHFANKQIPSRDSPKNSWLVVDSK